ncbi:MAG: winged helix-turn-helix domain-containing protein [Candidatus Zixiibacteriota bacterium]
MSVDREAGTPQLPEIDRLIHEPARYNIMALLFVVGRAEFLFVQNQTRLTPGNLSAHVSKLEAAQYLLVQKEFVGKKPKTFLKLTRCGRGAFENYHHTMKKMFSQPLGD